MTSIKPYTIGLIALLAFLAGHAAQAQEQRSTLKGAVTVYDPHSKTNGITGIGVPPGADAKVGNAATLLLTYEYALWPNLGVEFVLGIPPKIKTKATGSVAFLGKVLTARILAPTVFLNYHFNQPGDTWRPYIGVGLNYTKFVDIKSSISDDVELGDSWGIAGQIGVDYAINRNWGLFTSIAAVKVKTKLVSSGSTVLKSTVDLRPLVYTAGVSYRW